MNTVETGIEITSLPCNAPLGNISIIGVQDNGIIKPCCQFKSSPNSWQNIHNLNSLQDVYKNNEWINYNPNINCITCIWKEKGNAFSLRQHYNKNPIEGPALQSLELAFDNTCNMMCRICNPGQSSKWSASPIVTELKNNILNSTTPVQFHPVENQKVKNYREDLKRILSNTDLSKLRFVSLVGGEPLYTKALPWFINLLKEKRPNDWHKIEITCCTNGSLMPDPVLFENFPVNFQISIDGIGDLATASRLKIPWETIDKNICAMNELYNVTIHSTISILNINKISELVDYCYDLGIQHNMALLHDPAYYRLDLIPLNHRKEWIEHNPLDKWPILYPLDKWPSNNNKYYQNVSDYLMMPHNGNPIEVKNFLKAIEITDKESTIPFRDANPEIINIMEVLDRINSN